MSISILTVSGSFRAQSTNTRLLEELPSLLGPKEAVFNLYDGVEALPQFNPDKEHKINEHTEQWIELVRSSDALIVSSPEYAHGIPGALKNALDWLVGTDAFIEKPFCQYRVCPRSHAAPEALLEVLKTMSGIHLSDCDLLIDLERNYNRSSEKLSDSESRLKIEQSLKKLLQTIRLLKINE